MKNIEFIHSYSFIFSARPGTPAFGLKKVDQKISKERLINFQSIAERIKTNYRKTLINKIIPVLFENKIKNENKYFGRDEYFNSVVVQSDNNLSGKIINVKILKSNQNTLYGKFISKLNYENFAA